MALLELPDALYEKARSDASRHGFKKVEDYIVSLIDADNDEPDLTHIFTPERMAEIDRISAEVKAGGKTYSLDEIKAEFGYPRSPKP